MSENTSSSLATAAIVVSHNGLSLLEQNLPSLLRQSIPFRRILLVDNGSNDGTQGFVESVEGVELLPLERNLGFAAANNRAIDRALEDERIGIIATINNDVRLSENWHEQALAAFRDQERRAAVGPVGSVATLMLQQNHPDLIDSAGILLDDSCRADNRWHGAERQRADEEPAITAVWGPSAAAALYTRELLQSIGAFDESFFAYQEDVDLALRARQAGFRCLFAARAEGWHLGHASNRSFPFGGTRADFLNARNRIAVMKSARQYGRPTWPMLHSLGLDLLRSVRQGNAPAVWSGIAMGLARRLASKRSRDDRTVANP